MMRTVDQSESPALSTILNPIFRHPRFINLPRSPLFLSHSPLMCRSVTYSAGEQDFHSMDKKALGWALGKGDPMGRAMLAGFVQRFDFRGLRIDSALRQFLGSFRLPGEAQMIDRIVEGFGRRYNSCNPGQFKHEDTSYILAFSIVMLNTDRHSSAVRKSKKMTREQWRRNNREIDDGEDIDPKLLDEIFDSIVSQPLAYEQSSSSSSEKENCVESTPTPSPLSAFRSMYASSPSFAQQQSSGCNSPVTPTTGCVSPASSVMMVDSPSVPVNEVRVDGPLVSSSTAAPVVSVVVGVMMNETTEHELASPRRTQRTFTV